MRLSLNMCLVAWLHSAFAYCFDCVQCPVWLSCCQSCWCWVFAIVLDSPLLISLLAHAYAERTLGQWLPTRSQPDTRVFIVIDCSWWNMRSVSPASPNSHSISIQFPISMPSNLSCVCKFNLLLETHRLTTEWCAPAAVRSSCAFALWF